MSGPIRLILGAVCLFGTGWYSGREISSHHRAVGIGVLILLGLGSWLLYSAWQGYAEDQWQKEWRRRRRLSPEELRAEDIRSVHNDLLSAAAQLSQIAQRASDDDDRASLKDAATAVTTIRQALETLSLH